MIENMIRRNKLEETPFGQPFGRSIHAWHVCQNKPVGAWGWNEVTSSSV
jgi:hypothetical protein